jgi:hypothetical protein
MKAIKIITKKLLKNWMPIISVVILTLSLIGIFSNQMLDVNESAHYVICFTGAMLSLYTIVIWYYTTHILGEIKDNDRIIRSLFIENTELTNTIEAQKERCENLTKTNRWINYTDELLKGENERLLERCEDAENHNDLISITNDSLEKEKDKLIKEKEILIGIGERQFDRINNQSKSINELTNLILEINMANSQKASNTKVIHDKLIYARNSYRANFGKARKQIEQLKAILDYEEKKNKPS